MARRFFELVPSGTRIDFLRQRRLWLAISLAVIAIGLAAVPLRGLRLGVDFAGGTEAEVRVLGEAPVGEGDLRSALSAAGFAGAAVRRVGGGEARSFLVALAPATTQDTHLRERLKGALEARLGTVELARVEYVGPKVGAELRRGAVVSLLLSCVLIGVYMSFRFEPRYVPGAIVALVHDVLVTAGVLVAMGVEFDLSVVAGLLTLLGYSLNDTIVIFDRIRETFALHGRSDPVAAINRGLNETLSRTVLTAGTTLLALFALLVFGGSQLRAFSLTMAIGVVAGTYSSVYIASPVLLWLERRGKPRLPERGRRAAA